MEYFLNSLGFILIFPLALWIYYYGSHLHKHENKYYILAAMVGLITTVYAVYAQIEGIDVKALYPVLYAFLFQGHLTFAFFILVMFAGAFKPKSKEKIMLMKVRREMAIIGFILLMPHAALLVIFALTNLNPTGTIAFLLMIPLFITSFTKIRKKMHPLKWRKLHKLAYYVYAMIYLHVASITLVFTLIRDYSLEDTIFNYVRFALYTIIFGYYSYLKYIHYYLPKRTKKTA